MDKIVTKNKIKFLVDKYIELVKTNRYKKYNEEETKKDFILPLFEALGWNIHNSDEVSAEESQSGGRVDYGFYSNSRIKFYLEAKSLPTDLNREEYANQAIRYSWNKGVNWAVLTDFESIKVFNAQDISKYLSDKLFFQIPYTEYLSRFDQLWLLSRESFENNLLDREAEKVGKIIQKISVTDKLYKDLNECRSILINDLSQWNSDVSKELIDEGVQKILDRLIFLRVAEDRDIEPPILKPLIREWEGSKDKTKIPLYQSMVSRFREFDSIYNSNLFSPHPFEKWEDFSGATKKVLNKLYGVKGYYEYDFKAMPADVLGAVYENYLGYRLSESKNKSTLDKSDRKRKEQGIYYTPTYIVDYIINNTIKPIVDRYQSIDDLKKIKILDPACGSGSFLIKALQVIYEKYIEFGNLGGVYTKLGILLGNIYGVELDQQAVEITRLNLLLNALDERMKLPTLDKNIKNGNSLISGTEKELKRYFGTNYRNKRPFNWEEEFPEVYSEKTGGFDVIIGNPPYVFTRGGNFDESEKKYYSDKYELQEYQLNTYLLFIERAYKLLKPDGMFGFIIPNNWLTINTFSKLRKFLLQNTGDLKIINAIESVFSQASVDTCILIFKKTSPTTVDVGELSQKNITIFQKNSPSNFFNKNYLINIQSVKSKIDTKIFDKFKNSIPLFKVATVKSGLKAYEVGKGNPAQTKDMKDNRIYHSNEPKDNTWFKYLDGVDVGRYKITWGEQYIKYGDNLAAQRSFDIFSKKRILVRQIPSKPPYCINASYTNSIYVNDLNIDNIFDATKGYDLKYILSMINSKLISFWFIYTFNKFQRKIFPQFKVNELGQFPIFPADKQDQSELVSMVNHIMKLNSELSKAEENSELFIKIKNEIEKTNSNIDEKVYSLYSLSKKEISLVENFKM